MLEMTKKMIEEVEEIMDYCIKQIGFKDLTMMGKEDFEFMQKCIHLMETSKELAVKQAEMMDEQNRKLDLILEKMEKNAH